MPASVNVCFHGTSEFSIAAPASETPDRNTTLTAAATTAAATIANSTLSQPKSVPDFAAVDRKAIHKVLLFVFC